jgi:hypothetical protein
MVCENFESCGNFLYNFESSIDIDDGNFISRKYYCPSCYKEINVDLANEEPSHWFDEMLDSEV